MNIFLSIIKNETARNYILLLIFSVLLLSRAPKASRYLQQNAILTCLYNLYLYYCCFPKPYIGYHLAIFLAATAIYLFNPILLLISSIEKKSFHWIKISAIGFWLSNILYIYMSYPMTRSSFLQDLFNVYYLLLAISTTIVILFQNIKSKIFSLNHKVLLLLSLAVFGQMYIFTVLNQNWFWLQFSNTLFYLAIFLFWWLDRINKPDISKYNQ